MPQGKIEIFFPDSIYFILETEFFIYAYSQQNSRHRYLISNDVSFEERPLLSTVNIWKQLSLVNSGLEAKSEISLHCCQIA